MESKSTNTSAKNPYMGFKEISGEEALKILVGGPAYGISKFSRVNKAHGVPGVP